MGSKNQGQGHETTFKQILNERLGLDPADVLYVDGDTDRVGFGMGTMGSRSTVIGGTALWTAADKDRKSTRLNSSHSQISYAVFCLKKKKKRMNREQQRDEMRATARPSVECVR